MELLSVKLDNRAKFASELKGTITIALETIGLTAEGYAKENLTRNGNVDTGNLRNSITHKVVGKDVYIGTNVEYAAYVECGTGIYYPGGRQGGWVYRDEKGRRHYTYGSKAYPYLKPAATEHKKEYRALFEMVMRK